MKIMNHIYTRKELLRYCNPNALYSARRVELVSGKGRGQKLIEVKTSGGLRASFMEDKCLDILDIEYKGVNLAFLSKNGLAPSASINMEADSFTKYWSGGFLLTCGLRNTGPSCVDNEEFFPLHGRIGFTPAEDVNIHVCENEIVITGKIRETALFGPNLELERKITIPSDGAKIIVNDTINNLAPEAEKIFLLYHINFGFPFLSEDLELEFPTGEVKGRTALAQEKIKDRALISPPIDGEPELVFFYLPDKKDVQVGLTNNQLLMKATVSYNSTHLPILSQWKSMKSGDYALGIEPGTSFIRGRKEELENGYDMSVQGFGTLEFGFEINLEDIDS